MRKLFLLALVPCLLLPGVAAAACVPQGFVDPIVYWTQSVRSDSLLGVCPSGDWSGVEVTLFDLCAMPVVGREVVLAFADERVCDAAVAAFTDMYGHAHLVVESGLNSAAGTGRVRSAYTITCMGLVFASGASSFMSADYDCSQTVDALDFSFFSLDWMAASAPRSDFNDDGSVDALDFSTLALHWMHAN